MDWFIESNHLEILANPKKNVSTIIHVKEDILNATTKKQEPYILQNIPNGPYVLQRKYENDIGYMACPAQFDLECKELPYYTNLTKFTTKCIEVALDSGINPDDYSKELEKKQLNY